MDTKEIRKANLVYLIGNPSERGAAARFAKKYNLPPDQVRHVLTGFRPMGEKLARRFEEAIGLDFGTMDKPLDNLVMEEAANYAAQNQGESAVKLLKAFRNLKDDKKAMALRLIEALLEPENQKAP